MPTNVRLADYLQPANIAVPLRATTVKQALHEMVDRLRDQGLVTADEEFAQQLNRSRSRDVVAIGRGVILPHFRTDAVRRIVVSIGVAPEPLDTADTILDYAPRVVVLILAPTGAATLYLQTVAAIARLLSNQDVVTTITNARSADVIAALPELQTLKIAPELTVRDVMTRDVTTTSPDTPVRTVVDLMVDRKARAVVVTDTSRQVLGIITERDVMRAMLPHVPRVGEEMEQEEEDVRVRQVMTRSVLCVPEEMGLPEAINLMINKNAEQCPVVNDAELVGMLQRSEIIRKLFAR